MCWLPSAQQAVTARCCSMPFMSFRAAAASAPAKKPSKRKKNAEDDEEAGADTLLGGRPVREAMRGSSCDFSTLASCVLCNAVLVYSQVNTHVANEHSTGPRTHGLGSPFPSRTSWGAIHCVGPTIAEVRRMHPTDGNPVMAVTSCDMCSVLAVLRAAAPADVLPAG